MNICVYGAASDLIDKVYIEDGEALGFKMAERGHDLVFGGGGGGLMGAVARGVHRHGGVKITGIVPDFFLEDGKHVDGLLFDKIDEYIETDTMRERKSLLDELADGFIITPGGIGTYEELMGYLPIKDAVGVRPYHVYVKTAEGPVLLTLYTKTADGPEILS